jgi:hypothetical protein
MISPRFTFWPARTAYCDRCPKRVAIPKPVRDHDGVAVGAVVGGRLNRAVRRGLDRRALSGEMSRPGVEVRLSRKRILARAVRRGQPTEDRP